MFDTIDTPASPSPSSFVCRVRQIEAELLAKHGPLHVPEGTQGWERYFDRESNAILARRAEAERRALSETRFEGTLRRLMSELEAAATRRGRTLERRGYTDEQCPSLDAMGAQNAILRTVERMCVRLAELERAENAVPAVGFCLTDAGRAALAEASARSVA